mmetsp:Transcript_86852/g.254187  ORF Transcript_86852/g.254187 Transcript_86852/m.254187 type:complete len:340 (+) Transcript_86852:297-1316(+)
MIGAASVPSASARLSRNEDRSETQVPRGSIRPRYKCSDLLTEPRDLLPQALQRRLRLAALRGRRRHGPVAPAEGLLAGDLGELPRVGAPRRLALPSLRAQELLDLQRGEVPVADPQVELCQGRRAERLTVAGSGYPCAVEVREHLRDVGKVLLVQGQGCASPLAARRRGAKLAGEHLDVPKVRCLGVEPVGEEVLRRGRAADRRARRLAAHGGLPQAEGLQDLSGVAAAELLRLVGLHRVDAALWRRPGNIREGAIDDKEEVEGVVPHLVDDLARLKVARHKMQRQEARHPRRHVADAMQEVVLEEVAVKQALRYLRNEPPWHVLARDEVLHLGLVKPK